MVRNLLYRSRGSLICLIEKKLMKLDENFKSYENIYLISLIHARTRVHTNECSDQFKNETIELTVKKNKFAKNFFFKSEVFLESYSGIHYI